MRSHPNANPALLVAVKKLNELNPDQFELYLQKRTHTRIEVKEQKVDALSRAEDVGLAVRVLKNRRIGFSFTTSLERAAVERAVTSALEIATSMPEDPHAGLFSFGSSIYPTVDSLDSAGLALPLEAKTELAKKLERACRGADPRITQLRAAALSETLSEVQMLDSQSELLEHRASYYGASVQCKAEEAGDSQSGFDSDFSPFLDALDIETVGKRAAQNAVELLGAKSAPTMKCPAVLRNYVVAQLVSFLSDSFSAEQIDKGRSALAGKLGQQIFGENITIIDDPLFPGGLASTPFDGEGVPCRKTVLIDRGQMSGILYDTYYAKKAGTQSTGSARRDVKNPPSVSASNVFLQAGRKTPEQLLEGISKGILVTSLLGLHTANPITGDFSLGGSGILIEDGKLTRPVRGFAIAGNVLELFRRMTDISHDLRFFGSVGAPSVRVSEISVGGA